MRAILRAGFGLATTVLLAGCQTKGENTPIEEARFRVREPVVAERTILGPVPVEFPDAVMRVGGGLWQAGFRDFRLPPRDVQPVGVTAGLSFYALAWDSEPFDRLLVPVPGRVDEYREFLSVF